MGRIFTIDEAAELLKLNPQVVREYLRKGKLPGSKIGRHWRVYEDDLIFFVRTGRKSLTSLQDKLNHGMRTTDDSLREKHNEMDAEERHRQVREWSGLTKEEKIRRATEMAGRFADVPFSSDDLRREKREEVEREETRREERRGE